MMITYTKFGVRYLSIKKPPNVTTIEINAALNKVLIKILNLR